MDIAREIPDSPPWLPRLTTSEPPQRGQSYERYAAEFVARHFSRIVTTKYRWNQHWRRADFLEVDCGLTVDKTYEVKSGVSETERTEITSNLKAGIDQIGLGAEIGSTMMSQVTRESSETQSLTLKGLTPNKCQRQRVAIWQLVDEFVVAVDWVRRGGHKVRRHETRYLVPQSSTRTRAMLIDADECCEDQAERHAGMEPFRVSFPGGERVLYGSTAEGGAISLEGVEGSYVRGDSVPLSAFAADESWLAVPGGEALTFGVLRAAADEPWEAADDDIASDEDELAVEMVLFDAPLDEVRRLLGNTDAAAAYVARIRELAGGARSFEAILDAGFEEQTLDSLATRVLAVQNPETVGDPGTTDNESVFLYAATYGTRSAAIEDYERLIALHARELSDVFDVAVISTDDAGEVRVERDDRLPELASMRGLVISTAAEILLPGSSAILGALAGLDSVSRITQQLRRGISSQDSKELDEVLRGGEAALIAIGGSAVETQLDSALEGAKRSLKKAVSNDREQLKRELERVQQQSL